VTGHGDTLADLIAAANTVGDIGPTRFMGKPIVLVNAPELIHEVLAARADDFHKGEILTVHAKRLMGAGLLTSEGERNKQQRRLVAPAFTQRKLAAYAAVMVRYAEVEQAAWKTGTQVDAEPAMTRITLGIIGELLFGDNLLDEADGLGAAITTLMHFAVRRFRAVRAAPIWLPTPGQVRAVRALNLVNDALKRRIAARRASLDRGEPPADDILTLLLCARDENGGPEGMSDREVRDEALALFLGGLETVANALTWAWYLLDRHPHARARLAAEVDAVLAGRPPTVDDLAALPYALQIFKETLRVYPPGYTIARTAVRPMDLNGYALKKGDAVFISPYVLHRRPDIFPDPETFDPDRWTPAFEKSLPRYAYLPFGGGARICVGGHFALMEGQLLLATLAQRVSLSLAPGFRVPAMPEPLFTLRPRDGMPMIVTRRGEP